MPYQLLLYFGFTGITEWHTFSVGRNDHVTPCLSLDQILSRLKGKSYWAYVSQGHLEQD